MQDGMYEVTVVTTTLFTLLNSQNMTQMQIEQLTQQEYCHLLSYGRKEPILRTCMIYLT